MQLSNLAALLRKTLIFNILEIKAIKNERA